VRAFVTAGAGFLLAVLWFDLMFDAQVLRKPPGELPEPVLASIAGYYRRATTEARPMNRLVAAVMLATIAGIVVEVVRDCVPPWVAWASLVLTAVAVTLAGARTLPNAVRLGARRDGLMQQSVLARAIFGDHIFCFACIAAVLGLQLGWGT
jgi:hypothetical protein